MSLESQVLEFFTRFFESDGFPPRWFCGHWTQFHGWLFVLSDLAIWGAYTSIPIILLFFVKNVKDLPFPRIFWLFAAFIFACGTTHLFDALMFWWPGYRVMASIELVTALVSWATVAVLIPTIPKIMTFKSPTEMERIIEERTAELQESEARFRSVMEFSPLGMALFTLDGKCFQVNKALCRMLGYSAEDLLNQDVDSYVHPDDREIDRDQWVQLASGKLDCYQVSKRYFHQDGQVLYVDVIVFAVSDTTGTPQFIIHKLQDMTENRRLEQQRKNFIGALTHDLRAPLTAEKIALSVLKRYQENASENAKELFESLAKNNEDLLSLVNQLIEAYQYESGKVSLSRECIDLSQVVGETLISLSPLLESKAIQVSQNIPSEVKQVLGNFQQLKRVFSNLIDNAVANIPVGSRIEITAADHGDMVQILLQDNGPGISSEVLANLFEPYYTSRRKFEAVGSGLGLSIIKSIIELHQGKIFVTSSPETGTVFCLTLPRYHPSPASVSPG